METLEITDTERLDFLEKYVEATQAEENDFGKKFFIIHISLEEEYCGPNIRRAIDSAIRGTKDKK